MSIVDRSLCVITCAYNAERTLPEALESVFASTIRPTVFVVDDASPVSLSGALVARYGQIPEGVVLLRNDRNVGPSGSRNRAARAALERGFEYAAILDADDLVHPARFERQLEALRKNPTAAVVGSWGFAVDEYTLEIIERVEYPPRSPLAVRRALCFDNYIINTSAMLRLAVWAEVGGWDENLRTAEDLDFFCKIVRSHDIINIPEPLVTYRLSRQGISRSGVTAQRRARLKVLMRHLPGRAHRLEAWGGVLRSLVRVMIPTPLIEGLKQRLAVRRLG